MSNLTDIRAVKMEEAGRILAPVLADIYVKHGLDLTTTLLMYYAVKGIMLSYDLTAEEKQDKLKQAHSDYLRAITVLQKSVDKQDTVR